MRLTIVTEDGVVGIGGLFYQVALTGLAAGVRAVQFYGTEGEVEYNDGRPNAAIDSVAEFQPLIDRWQVAHDIATAPPPPPTPEQIIAGLTREVQAHLDATARTRNYDGILSLCSYAASAHPTFVAEGLAGVAWRDAVWAACYAVMAAVQAGTRAAPTPAELLAELPPMVWPA
jgi:hypothetical protein